MKKQTFILLFLILFFLSGCRMSSAVAGGTPLAIAQTEVATPTLAPPSETIIFIATDTLPPTNTPISTNALVPATITPIVSPTPSKTPPPTVTFTPSPTPVPQWAPGLNIAFTPGLTDSYGFPIPTPVPTFVVERGVTNILLVAHDAGGNNADTIIIVSVNYETQIASMLSLPRDLYVYFPDSRIDKINTTGNADYLKTVILYNFGVPIHYYVEIEFEGFTEIVDALGGIEVAVGCELEDWRLKEPGLDINVEENYEFVTMVPGVYEMDGFTALWYSRSRITTSDFDRNRRQQQVLRAILDRGVDLGLIAQVPALWQTYRDRVETDLDIGRILQLATVAQGVRDHGIQHLHLRPQDKATFNHPIRGDGFVTVWEKAEDTVERLFRVSSLNSGSRTVRVEIRNHSGNPAMGQLAADNLAWYGVIPVVTEEDGAVDEQTVLTYYGSDLKGSYDWLVKTALNYGGELVLDGEESDSDYQFTVVLGADYNSCLRHQDTGLRENLP